MKPGRSLEKLVAYLERYLAAPGTVIVESPKRMPDKTTGKLREHDVVLTVTSGHHTILVAVECRDRSRPVGVPQIEGFAKKCSETLIDKGVIVSPCGFTSTALLKSKALGIKCLSLDDVNAFPWMFSDFKFKQFHTAFNHFDFEIVPEENFPNKPKAFELVNDCDEVVPLDNLRNSLFNAIKGRENNPVTPEIGEKAERFRFIVPNLMIRDKDTGIIRKVQHINAIVNSETKVEEVPFDLQEYKDATSKTAIAQLAIAKVDFGFAKGRFIINHSLATGGEVVFIPDADKPRNRIKTEGDSE